MKIAYFDCFAGIAGDMTLAALLDCGIPLEELKTGLASLPVRGWDIEATPVLKSGIHALNVRITEHGISDEEELAHAHHHGHHAHEHHAHEHSHTHGDEHEHSHHTHHLHAHDEHGHEHGHNGHHEHHHHEHHHGRSMAEIREIIEGSTLNERVKAMSLAVFGRIAEVEAKMHHSTPEEIHFHEIGGLDSLLDIVGVAWCLDYLGIDEVYCSALPHSTGFVDCAHGRMPVPAPATQELLTGVPMVPTDIRGEMVTPTGAGLMAVLAQGFGSPPAMTPRQMGFGAGKKEWPDRPNMLRVVIGESLKTEPRAATAPDGLEWQELAVLECNIDDMNPEHFSGVFDRSFAAGALDVWLQPIQMKKNRPGWLLSVLCPLAGQNKVLAVVLRETTTLGVRVRTVRRAALPREMQTVETRFGAIPVKVAAWPEGGVRRATPEHAVVEEKAAQHGVPLREVYLAAQVAAEFGENNPTSDHITNSSRKGDQ